MLGVQSFSQNAISVEGRGLYLACSYGSYLLSGKAISFVLAKKIALPNGSYSLTGNQAYIHVSNGLYGIFGQYSLSGQQATFRTDHSISLRYGFYNYTGCSAALGYNIYGIPSITVDEVVDAVADYLSLFTSSIIIRGNVNRTSMPDGSFIALTELSTKALVKPIETYDEYFENINEHNQIDIRADFYGWELANTIRAVHNSFRTLWSTQQFPSNIVPLFCSEPIKLSYENAEDQYEQRWFMTISLQFNPSITVPQLSFSKVGETVCRPDVLYPDILYS